MRSSIKALAILWLGLLGSGGVASAANLQAQDISFQATNRSGTIDVLEVRPERINFKITLTSGSLDGLAVSRLDPTASLLPALGAGGDPNPVAFSSEVSGGVARFSFPNFRVGASAGSVRGTSVNESPRFTLVNGRSTTTRGGGLAKDKDADMVMTGTLFVDYTDIAVGDMIFFQLLGGTSQTFQATVTPEPGTLLLYGLGMGGLALMSRRRQPARAS